MDATAEDRWQLVKTVIEMTDGEGNEGEGKDGEGNEKPPMAEAADLIRASGIVARQHTGMPPDWFTSQTTAEWLLGSYLDIVDNDASDAIDPWLSVASDRLARAEGAA